MPSTTGNAAEAATIAVSVVVPTCGRLDLLDRSLDALTRQDYPAGACEIIIVDDEPSRNTLQLVAGWRARTLDRGVRLVYIANDGAHGMTAARNRGWRAAKGPVIAFTGDDTVPSPGWLAYGMAAFDAGTDVVCGRIDTPAAARDGAANPADEAPALDSANCFCRRAILEALDGFDERFRDDWRADSDLHFRLLETGATIVREPQALVVRPARRAPWGASLLQLHKISFDALLYKKHPALYRKNIRRLPCWEDYTVVAALIAGIAGLAVSHEVLAVTGWGAWLVLTAMLCISRLRGSAANASHVADMLLTSALIPPLAVFWRMLGAIKYRVRFA